jgi:fatty acid desaturase
MTTRPQMLSAYWLAYLIQKQNKNKREAFVSFFTWKGYVSLRFITDITQFRVTITTNCRVLTRYTNVSYAVSYEQVSHVFFQCIVSILWALIMFWCDHVTKETTIYESHSWDTALNVGLNASVNTTQGSKGIRKKVGVNNSGMNFLLAQV